MFKEGLLKGKRILVTGGGTGLGKEIAKRYAELGAELWIAGRRGGVLDATAKEISSQYQVPVKTHVIDIRDAQAVDAMVERIWQESGPLTGLEARPGQSGDDDGVLRPHGIRRECEDAEYADHQGGSVPPATAIPPHRGSALFSQSVLCDDRATDPVSLAAPLGDSH